MHQQRPDNTPTRLLGCFRKNAGRKEFRFCNQDQKRSAGFGNLLIGRKMRTSNSMSPWHHRAYQPFRLKFVPHQRFRRPSDA